MFPRILRSFRPEDESLPPRTKAQVQVYRLLSLLGAVLFPAFGLLYKASSLEAVDPIWGRLAISGLLVGLFGASFLSEKIRRHYVGLAWGLLYLTMAWVTVLTALNQFSGEYAVAFLFTYALFGGIVALGSESLAPVLWFFGAGFLLVGGGFWGASSFHTRPLLLTAIMALVVLFQGVCTWWVLWMRDRLAGQRRTLRRHRDLLRRTQKVAKVGGWEYDPSTDTVEGTDQFNQILGVPEGEDFTAERVFQLSSPDEQGEVRQNVSRCLEQGIPFNLEVPLARTADQQRWVRVRGERQRTEEGSFLLTGTLQDITEQKEVERVLREEQEVLRQMYHVTADREAAFDAKVEDLIDLGRSYLDLSYGYLTRISGDTQEITHVVGEHPMFSTGEPFPLSQSYCRKTVEEGLLAVQNAPDEGWEGDPVSETFGVDTYIGSRVEVDGDLYGTFCFAAEAPRERPFSEREQTFVELLTLWVGYEIDRRRATRQLENQNQRLDRFASVVSHDLRNPLNVAKGRFQLAKDALSTSAALDTQTPVPHAEGDEGGHSSGSGAPRVSGRTEAADHLHAAGRALERMNELIEDMLTLTWGRREADRDEIVPVNLRTVAEQCWPDVEGTASLTVETDGDIMAHEGRLQQLLENLFRNALEQGGADVAVRVGMLSADNPEADASTAGFFVEDDGPGIPDEKREKVLKTGYTTSEDGTGLGLSIARSVADSHDWSLSIAEGRDGGARFEIRGARGQQ
ncbi:MAG: ATP-binding protein [Salinibacter sp.]